MVDRCGKVKILAFLMHKKITIVTHSGSFHPDDVFAVATLLLMLDSKPVETRVIRSRDSEVIKQADFIVDVGAISNPTTNNFDHHQTGGAGARANGVPYASFGLVWKQFGSEITGSEKIAGLVDRELVQPIDYGDNFATPLSEIAPGIYPYTFDRLISVFCDTYEENNRNTDEVFFQLVSFAKQVLIREIAQAKELTAAQPAVESAYQQASDKRVIVLEDHYPWYQIISKYPEPLFVVFPSDALQWGVMAVRKGEHQYENRKDFPKDWCGKRNEELASISGVSDAVFCHNRLFFAVAKSKEGALELARKALDY